MTRHFGRSPPTFDGADATRRCPCAGGATDRPESRDTTCASGAISNPMVQAACVRVNTGEIVKRSLCRVSPATNSLIKAGAACRVGSGKHKREKTRGSVTACPLRA